MSNNLLTFASMKNILLYLWQLPQNLIGLCLIPFYRCDRIVQYLDRKIRYCTSFPGGISLGNYIFVGDLEENTVKHEYGHSLQSKYLGPLYLLVIGLPSIIWAACYDTKKHGGMDDYYKFYTESWADKLGGVNR